MNTTSQRTSPVGPRPRHYGLLFQCLSSLYTYTYTGQDPWAFWYTKVYNAGMARECWSTVKCTLNPPVLTHKANIPAFYVFLCLRVCLFVGVLCAFVLWINKGRHLYWNHIMVDTCITSSSQTVAGGSMQQVHCTWSTTDHFYSSCYSISPWTLLLLLWSAMIMLLCITVSAARTH